MEFIRSSKNKNLLKYNGYLYRCEYIYNISSHWRSNEDQCKSRLHLINEEILLKILVNIFIPYPI